MDPLTISKQSQNGVGTVLVGGLLLLTSVILGGCRGGVGTAAGAPTIVMEEMRFTPNRVDMKVGESVTLTLVNKGTVRHDLAFPSAEMPGLAGIETLTLPGQTTHVTLRFDKPGAYRFICTIEGHAASGMTGAVFVSP
jgi:uncharacterized cupredoxin-like copper-binding protein